MPASQPNYVGIDGVLEGLCPPYVTDMDAAVDQVLEEKFGPGGTYTDAEVFAQSYKDKATAETYMKQRRPPAGRGDRVHEGDLPLPGGHLRALPGAHGRVPPARHLGAVLAPGDRVLRAVRQPRATRSAQAEGRRSGTATDLGNDVGRMTGLTLFTPIRRQWLWVLRSASRCARYSPLRDHILQFNFIKYVRWTIVDGLDGEKLQLPLPVLREQLRRAWQHYIDAFAYVIPNDIRLTWGRGPDFPRPAARPSR